ncbi:hypothetical protein [Roseimaritima ulvae]|uniref:Uncharacterized protein n=1 Tax=Roseimaritima ulvae TaxID=980254 RepID=A0A5B9QX22_9BACT|nr:hypothetical protein [Roseimaritima ulvae]QEG38503.1 hypothetical protein UC8_04600 [Roseimaritima ulvae]
MAFQSIRHRHLGASPTTLWLALFWLAGGLTTLSPSVLAQPPESAATAEPAAADIDRLIEALGSPRFSARNAASRQLRALGPPAAEKIAQAATAHPDNEVRRRAQLIHKDFRYGLFPDTATDVVTAVRDIRDGDLTRQQRGLHALLKAEEFDTLLLAIRLEPSLPRRSQLASIALEHPTGQQHFLQQAHLASLLRALAPPGQAIDEDLQWNLFTPAMIAAVVQQDQLQVLLDFLDTLPAEARLIGWTRIASSPVAANKLLQSDGVEAIFQFIDRAESKAQRTRLAKAFVAHWSVLENMLEAESTPRLMAYLDDPQPLLKRLFTDLRVLPILMTKVSEQQMLDWFDRFSSDDDKLAALKQVGNYAKMQGNRNPQVLPAMRARLTALQQRYKQSAKPAGQLAYCLLRLGQLNRVTEDNVATRKQIIEEIIQIDASLTLPQLLAVSRVPEASSLLAEPPHLEWFLSELQQLPLRERTAALRECLQRRVFPAPSDAPSVALFFRLLDIAIKLDEAPQFNLVAACIRNIRSAEPPVLMQLRKGIFERMDGEHPQPTRLALLSGLVSNRYLIDSLITERGFDQVVARVDAVESADARAKMWEQLLRQSRVPTELVRLKQTERLLDYRNPQRSVEIRQLLLNAVVNSSACLKQLLEDGELPHLLKKIQQVRDTDQRWSMLTIVMSHPHAIEHYVDEQQVSELNRFLKSIPTKQLPSSMLRFLSGGVQDETVDVLGDTLWQRIRQFPLDNRPTRTDGYRRLLGNAAFLNWLVNQGHAQQVLPRLREDLPPKDRATVLTSLTSSSQSVAWLEAVSLDRVLEFARHDMDRMTASKWSSLLGGSAVRKLVESHDQLDRMMQIYRDLAISYPATGNSSYTTLLRGQMGYTLARSGYADELLELCWRDVATIDLSALQHLLRQDAVAAAYLQNHSATDMRIRFWQDGNRDAVYRLLAAMLQNARWCGDWVRRGELSSLAGVLLSEPRRATRDEALAALLTAPSAAVFWSDEEYDELYKVIREANPASNSAMRDLARSTVACNRLLAAGHLDDLVSWAEKHDETRFFDQPRVFASLSEAQQAARLEAFDNKLNTRMGSYSLPRNSAVMAAFIARRGLTPILERLDRRRKPYVLRSMWQDRLALTAVLARGELELLWQASQASHSSSLIFGLSQFLSERADRQALSSPETITAFTQWLESLPDEALKNCRFLTENSIAGCFYRADLGERYAKLANRMMALRHGSASPLTKRPIPATPLSLQIRRGEIQAVANILRDRGPVEHPSEDATGRWISFLLANQLLDAELQSLRDKPDDQRTEEEQRRIVRLLHAAGRQEPAVQAALKAEMPSLATILTIQHHDWQAATELPVPDLQTDLSAFSKSSAPTDPAYEQAQRAAIAGMLAWHRGQTGGKPEDQWAAVTAAMETLEELGLAREGLRTPQDDAFGRYVSDLLTMLGQPAQGTKHLRHQNWIAFDLIRTRGYYHDALRHVRWGERTAEEYYDDATRSTPIDNSQRIRGIAFLLNIADTERLLGNPDRGDEIDNALAKFADQQPDQAAPAVKAFQQELLAQWLLRGNIAACRKWFADHPQIEKSSSLGTELLRGTLSKWIAARQLRRDGRKPPHAIHKYLVPLDYDRIRLFVQDPYFGESLLERMLQFVTVETSPLDHEAVQAYAQHVAGQLRTARLSGSTTQNKLLDVVVQRWGRAGQTFPMDDELRAYWLKQTQNVETLRWHAVSRFAAGDYAACVQVLNDATWLAPERSDLIVLQAQARLRAATDEPQRQQAEDAAQLAQSLLYLPIDRLQLAASWRVIGEAEAAMEQWRLVRRTTLPDSDDFLWATTQLADATDDVAEVADLRREQLIWMCRPTLSRGTPVQVLHGLQMAQQAAMQDALARGDFETLERLWKELRWANSSQPQWLHPFIFQVDAAGGHELADQMFASEMNFITERIERYPDSGSLLAQRAMLCLTCVRKLDTAKSDIKAALALGNIDRKTKKRMQVSEHTPDAPAPITAP